jgi:hypothetical protein
MVLQSDPGRVTLSRNRKKQDSVGKVKPLWITTQKGCVDHPVFPTRMPGYSIADCETKEFDAFNLETGKREKTGVEGRRTKLTYRVEDRSKEPSGLSVVLDLSFD